MGSGWSLGLDPQSSGPPKRTLDTGTGPHGDEHSELSGRNALLPPAAYHATYQATYHAGYTELRQIPRRGFRCRSTHLFQKRVIRPEEGARRHVAHALQGGERVTNRVFG